MHVVSQADGKVLWKVDWPTRLGENSADPLIIGDKLYLSSWWGEGAALFDPNLDSTKPIWTNKKFQNHINPPVLHEGHLYGFDGPVHKKNQIVSPLPRYQNRKNCVVSTRSPGLTYPLK